MRDARVGTSLARRNVSRASLARPGTPRNVYFSLVFLGGGFAFAHMFPPSGTAFGSRHTAPPAGHIIDAVRSNSFSRGDARTVVSHGFLHSGVRTRTQLSVSTIAHAFRIGTSGVHG